MHVGFSSASVSNYRAILPRTCNFSDSGLSEYLSRQPPYSHHRWWLLYSSLYYSRFIPFFILSCVVSTQTLKEQQAELKTKNMLQQQFDTRVFFIRTFHLFYDMTLNHQNCGVFENI